MSFADIVGVFVTVLTEVWMLRNDQSAKKPEQMEKALWTVPVLQLLLFFLLFFGADGSWMKWLYLLILSGVDLAVCMLLKERERVREKRKCISVLYTQREKELKYYEHVAEYLHEMSVIRHEFANQMQVLYSMLENDADVGEIYKMLDQMKDNLIRLNPEKTDFDS